MEHKGALRRNLRTPPYLAAILSFPTILPCSAELPYLAAVSCPAVCLNLKITSYPAVVSHLTLLSYIPWTQSYLTMHTHMILTRVARA